jgi:excisionase family DNA binding protein
LGAQLLRYGPDDVVTTADAAQLVHVGASTIRKWHSQGHLEAVARGRYRVGDVLDCSAARRARRVT